CAGLDTIDGDLIEAARGNGMTPFQTLLKVKIPLALPVIMAGVRISAVTAVGLVTLAAFIGAGGLGYLVYSGIRTVNNAQILAGAASACALALVIDFFASQIERAISPIALRPDIKRLSKARIRRLLIKQRVVLAASLAALTVFFALLAFSARPQKAETIVVGAVDYTEQAVLGNLYADLIEEKTGLRVDRRLNLGGTFVVWSAFLNREVDLYIEYTGTLYSNILKQDKQMDSGAIYALTKRRILEDYGALMLSPIGFNNTYALAVRPDTAEEYSLSTVSDLARVSSLLTASPTIEFTNRADGLKGLLSAYDMQFKQVIPLDGTPRYTALINRQSDVTTAFSTDGIIDEFNLVILEDDRSYFPPYDAVPLVKPELIEKHPELGQVIELLAGAISDRDMRAMNYKVDVLKQSPEDVARDFLRERGLIR
ncbi:MAG: ABC transporter permease subunit, partial [Spirochaetaceae bacterium]|nr:ABC transporter permease subunit [Spirochaetaceae bacterium]